jgi:hypothetical protein
MRWIRFVCCVAILFVSSRVAFAQTTTSTTQELPRVVAFSGQLRTATEAPRTSPALLTFALYADQIGGAPLWVEQQAVTPDNAGSYAVLLGSTSPDGLPLAAFSSNTARWLGITVDADAEQPRIILISVPYALKAADADTVGGKAATDFVLATNLTSAVREVVKTTSTSSTFVTNSIGTASILQKGNGSGGTTDTVAPIFEDSLGRIGIGIANPPSQLANTSANIVDGASNGMAAGQAFRWGANESGYVFGLKQSSAAGDAMGVLVNIAGVGVQRVFTAASSNTDRFVVQGNGNIGIGVSSPPSQLANTTSNILDGVSNGMSAGQAFRWAANESGYVFGLKQSSTAGDAMGVVVNIAGTGAQRILSAVSGNTDRLVVQGNGNVGVGVSSPTSKLHVVGDGHFTGDVTVDGNIAAKYQDVAEWVESAHRLDDGTIVIIDSRHPNQVIASATAYDTRVAGAVSRQPGVVLGERGDTKSLVAQSGRVRIKVDARYGAIRIGDLLVTSSTPGYAMRVGPRRAKPGTILGKALEELPSGQGEILALLTLQ